MPNKKNASSKHQPNVYAAIRDVFKHAINNGVIVPVGMMGIFALLVFNISSDNKYNFLVRTIEIIDHLCGLGWFFLILSLLFWRFHFKLITSEHLREVDRIGLEKTGLQEKLAGNPLASSSNAVEETQSNAD